MVIACFLIHLRIFLKSMQKIFHPFICAVILFTFSFSLKVAAQCDPPLAVGDFSTTIQATAVVIDVQQNDTTNVFGQPLVAGLVTEIVAQPTVGTGSVSVLNNDSVVFTPNPNFVGLTFFTYRVCLPQCSVCSAPVTVAVNVTKFCEAPLAADDIFNVYNNTNNRLDVVVNDTLKTQIPYTLSIVSTPNPAHGVATVSGNQINYLNTDNFTGSLTFEYSICFNRPLGDTCPSCDTALVELNIIGNCVAPVANEDLLQSTQGERDTVDVLATDDLNSFTLTGINIVKGANHGLATLVNNKIVYQSNVTFAGNDTVAYEVCTACGCDTAVLVIAVAPAACQRPIAILDVAPTGYSENCPFTYPVLVNDINPLNCGSLKLTEIVWAPQFGTAVLDTTIPAIVYTGPGFNLDTFVSLSYSVCNDAGCDTAELVLFVGPFECNAYVPTLFNDQGSVCNRDTLVMNVLKNDFDRDFGQKVSLKNIAGLGAHGDAYVVNDSVVMFIPYDTSYAGSDFFFYTACDDANPTLCDIARVDLTIFKCNNPPVINENGNPIDTIHVTFPEDSSVTICYNVTDIDNDPTRVVTISGNIIPATTVDTLFSKDSTVCVNIVPIPDWNGRDTFNVVVCDVTNLCDTVVVVVYVTPVSDGIKAVDDSVTYVAGTTLAINQTANDIDDDGNGIETTAVFDDANDNGTFVLNNGGNIEYTPNTGFAGVDTFYYVICTPVSVSPQVCDTGIVQVVVPVTAVDDNASTPSDASVFINVKQNDATVEGSYFSTCGEPQHGKIELTDTFAGIIRYTPTLGYEGVDSFCYTVCGIINGIAVCDNAMVYVNVAPLPPLEIPEGFSPNNDGINDKFEITNIDRYPLSQFMVFNRWGDVVWENDGEGYKNDFDGTWQQNNQPLPDATYYFVLKLNDNKTKDIVGFVVINR